MKLVDLYIVKNFNLAPFSFCHSSAGGISRSVTITILYVMCISLLGMEESLAVVKFCRDVANPNAGFRKQLKKFAKEQLEMVISEWRTNFVMFGVIATV